MVCHPYLVAPQYPGSKSLHRIKKFQRLGGIFPPHLQPFAGANSFLNPFGLVFLGVKVLPSLEWELLMIIKGLSERERKESIMVMHIRDIMNKNELITIRPNTSIGDLQHVLTENGISGVPVVNDSGELIGVVSQSDILRFIGRELDQNLNFYSTLDKPHQFSGPTLDHELRSRQVWEIMQTRLHTVSPIADIPTTARILRNHNIHRVLVVDGKKLVGIVTTFDLIRILENPQLVKEFWGNMQKKEPQTVKSNKWSPFNNS